MNAVMKPAAVPFEPGVYTAEQLPIEQYHAIEALSASGIKRLLQSPMHYRYWRDHPEPETESQLLGTALHMAILEPDRFDAEVVCLPLDAPKKPSITQRNAKKPSPETLEAIAWWDEWQRRTARLVVLSRDQRIAVHGMALSVRQHRAYRAFIETARTEVSFLWRDAVTGTPCRARFDALNKAIGLDAKSTRDASPAGFRRAVGQYGYHIQAALYARAHRQLTGERLDAFLFAAVENEPPYASAIYVLDDEAIEAGAKAAVRAMRLYSKCMQTGSWPGYSPEVAPLDLPPWVTAADTNDSTSEDY